MPILFNHVWYRWLLCHILPQNPTENLQSSQNMPSSLANGDVHLQPPWKGSKNSFGPSMASIGNEQAVTGLSKKLLPKNTVNKTKPSLRLTQKSTFAGARKKVPFRVQGYYFSIRLPYYRILIYIGVVDLGLMVNSSPNALSLIINSSRTEALGHSHRGHTRAHRSAALSRPRPKLCGRAWEESPGAPGNSKAQKTIACFDVCFFSCCLFHI